MFCFCVVKIIFSIEKQNSVKKMYKKVGLPRERQEFETQKWRKMIGVPLCSGSDHLRRNILQAATLEARWLRRS